ncbi:hypothetical protein [Microbulbifer sp.]|uniref:hypothetical protein n=1 Tax=Microbulbifer sp. TaxID=1908541 RepID=UPI003F2E5A8F
MDDIYKAPSSDLEENTDAKFSPHGFWKLFFWIHVVLTPLVLLVVIFEENISVYDYIDLSVFLFNLVVLFGYAFSKKIGGRRFWKGFCFAYIAWVIFYEMVAPFLLDIAQYGDPPTFDMYFVLVPLFTIPTACVIYLYAYKAKHVWDS